MTDINELSSWSDDPYGHKALRDRLEKWYPGSQSPRIAGELSEAERIALARVTSNEKLSASSNVTSFMMCPLLIPVEVAILASTTIDSFQELFKLEDCSDYAPD